MSMKSFKISYNLKGEPVHHKVKSEDLILGRSLDCDISIPSEIFSREHFRLFSQEGELFVVDLDSTNGTFVNGLKLTPNKAYRFNTTDKLYVHPQKQFEIQILTNDVDFQTVETTDSHRLSDEHSYSLRAEEKSESMVDSFAFLVKKARFSKEQEIKKAEEFIEEMMNKAEEDIEKKRKRFNQDVEKHKEQVELLAKNHLEKANLKAKTMMEAAQEKVKNVILEAEKNQYDLEKRAEKKYQDIIAQAQEKSSQVIGESFLKNKKLVDENSDLEKRIQKHRASIEADKNTAIEFAVKTQKNEKNYIESQTKVDSEDKKLQELKIKTEDLELKNKKEKEFLEKSIPRLKKSISEMSEKLEKAMSDKELVEKEIKLLLSDKESTIFQLNKTEDEVGKSQLRLDHLVLQIKESEESLSKINDVKEKRYSEIEVEVESRRAAQDYLEQQTAEKNKKMYDEARLEALNYIKDEKIKSDKKNKERKEKVIAAAQNEAEKLEENAKKKSQALLKKMDQRVKKEKALSDKEIKRARENAELEVNKLKEGFVLQLKQQKKEFEREEEGLNRVRRKKLENDLKVILRSRLKPYLEDEADIEKIDHILVKSMNSIFNEDADEGYISKSGLDGVEILMHQQKKVKKFWGASVCGIIAIIFIAYNYSKIEKSALDTSRSIASVEKQEIQNKIIETQKSKDLTKEYNPEKSNAYLESYSKRVLHTTGYVDRELSGDYREAWIIALQDYFLKKLKLNEDHLVPFVALEANLVRELKEESQKINGRFVDQGITRMKEIESTFLQKLSENIKNKNNLKKVMEFKKEFYLNYKIK